MCGNGARAGTGVCAEVIVSVRRCNDDSGLAEPNTTPCRICRRGLPPDRRRRRRVKTGAKVPEVRRGRWRAEGGGRSARKRSRTTSAERPARYPSARGRLMGMPSTRISVGGVHRHRGGRLARTVLQAFAGESDSPVRASGSPMGAGGESSDLQQPCAGEICIRNGRRRLFRRECTDLSVGDAIEPCVPSTRNKTAEATTRTWPTHRRPRRRIDFGFNWSFSREPTAAPGNTIISTTVVQFKRASANG